MEKEILLRLDRCVGCKSCELACSIAHSSDSTLQTALAEKPQKRLFVEQYGPLKAPITCHHCAEAYCSLICPTHAMQKCEDGTVTNVDTNNRCIGCWLCVMACPSGVISKGREGKKAIKCDRMCLDECGLPACVRACPTNAIVYTTVAEFEAARRAMRMAALQENRED